jgi:hypothetical protein
MKKHMKVVMLLAVSFYFMVASPPTINAAACLSVVPGSSTQGDQGLEVTIVGDNTSFTQGLTEVNFANPGITVTSVTADSPTQVRVAVDIAEDAPVGLNHVTVTTVAEVIICSNAFEVLEKIETDVTLTVGNGSGFPGSRNNIVEVSLDNPSAIVMGIQVDITDEGDHLTCTGCTPHPDRASQFNCFASELSDGGCRAVLVTFDPAEAIQIGNGPLLSIDYAIKGSAPAGECKNLTPGAIKVSGENNQSLDAVSVPGTFCFLSCQVNGECNDGNGCTDDTCNAGQCTYQCNAPSSSDLCCRVNPGCIADPLCSNPSDTDYDGIPNSQDNCQNVYNTDQTNSDNDSYGNACDNCFMTDNEDQTDTNGNGIGDACEDIECGDVWPPESSPGAMNCGDGVVDIYDIIGEIDLALMADMSANPGTPEALGNASECQLPRANVPTGTSPNYCQAPDGYINVLDVLVLVDKTLLRTDCCSFFVCLSDVSCSDDVFCNGVETCLDGECQPSADPCPGQMCNEINDQCADCLTDLHCDDGSFCNEINDQCVDCLTDLHCDDGSFCNGEETCNTGTCQGGGGNPCTPGASCNEAEDVCNCSLDEDCDDGLFCNGVGTCQDGVCQIVINPCPGQMCNETNDQCVDCFTDAQCNDQNFCTVEKTCVNGTCQGGDGNPCAPPYVCLESIDQCVMPAVTVDIGNGSGFRGTTDNSVIVTLDNPDDKVWVVQVDICDADNYLTCTGCELTGRVADSDFYCFTGDSDYRNNCCSVLLIGQLLENVIQEGNGPIAIVQYDVSTNAPAGECRDLISERAGVSDENGVSLGAESLSGEFCFFNCPSDQDCDDGNLCTDSDACRDGTCVGTAKDCSYLDDQCNIGICDTDTGDCVPDPTPKNGNPCADGLYCTDPDECTGGVCGGSARDCSSAGDQCNDGVCNETTDTCEPRPKTDGTACDDDVPCTENDICDNGACSGSAKDCTSLNDQCNAGICDAGTGNCIQDPTTLNGDPCDDGVLCTVDDTCDNGACGGTGKDCSSLNDQCNVGVCDTETGNCIQDPTLYNGNPCDDGNTGTLNDTCANGVCTGQIGAASIPTTSEWGMIIFMTVIMGLGVVTLFRRRIE